ncbi:MAG: type II/IV secretion system ATPase subunit [Thermoplasmata archaeon]|nr:MAG: type II/IV secretion system ATPase subunit [Thermoplasmata archaeon]
MTAGEGNRGQKPDSLYLLNMLQTPTPAGGAAPAPQPAPGAQAPGGEQAGVKQATRKKIKKDEGTAESEADEDEDIEEIDLIPIEEPLTYVRVTLDKKHNEYIYNVIEPDLNKKEQDMLEFILETLNRILEYKEGEIESEEEKREILKEKVNEIIEDYMLEINVTSKRKIIYYIVRDYVGYGKIDAITRDTSVEDVSCDGTAIPIFLYHREYGSIKSNVIYETDEELEGFIVSLAQRCGKQITVADPILDATLPDGSRMNATFGREITTRGSSYTIRRFKADPLTIVDLVQFNSLSPEMAAHLWMAVQYGESIIFAGGTASGKTSTMNSSAIFIPPSSKVISIEDTREVNLPHENWIAGVTRGGAEAESASDIDMYDLLRAALRQRPEYVIVGEVRGKETMTMFQAMATGHTTYSTMHADSVKSIVYRLENPPIGIPRVLLSALNLVVIHGQMRVKDKRVRRVTQIVEIIGIEPLTLEIITNQVYEWIGAGDTFKYGGHSNLYEKIMDLEDKTAEEVLEELNKRADIIRYLNKLNKRSYLEVWDIVAEYYENPDTIMEMVEEGLRGDK